MRCILVRDVRLALRRRADTLTEGQAILDLVRVTDSRSVDGVYEGICW